MAGYRLRSPHIANSLVLGCMGVAVILGPFGAMGPAHATGVSANETPPGRPMTARELRRLYSGKTWLWENGGGYWRDDGRFIAVTGKDRTSGSFARGTWEVNDRGRMCFEGVWTARGGRNPSKTCFRHFVAGDTIYQRREPAGAWYQFRSSPASKDDEFSKLVDGDQVSKQLRQLQAAFVR